MATTHTDAPSARYRDSNTNVATDEPTLCNLGAGVYSDGSFRGTEAEMRSGAGVGNVSMSKPGQKLEQSPSAEQCNRMGVRLLRLATQSEPIADPAVVYAAEIRRLELRGIGENEYANMAYDSGGEERSWFWENKLGKTRRLIEELTQRTSELRQTTSETARAMLLRHAFEWFERSAIADDPEGMWNCGWRYYLGEGVSPDRSKALLWWEKAAAKGKGTDLFSCPPSTTPSVPTSVRQFLL